MNGPGISNTPVLVDQSRAHRFEPTISALKKVSGFSLQLIARDRLKQSIEQAKAAAECPAVVLIGFEATQPPNDLPLIFIDQGSWICPAVVVHSSIIATYDTTDSSAQIRATRLALTPVAWEDETQTEFWRELHAPIPEGPQKGVVDITRPWALVDLQSVEPARRQTYASEIAAANRDWQFHAPEDAHPPGIEIIQWRYHNQVMAALLGKVQAVVSDPGPLCFDAWRLGKPVFSWQHARSGSLYDGDSAVPPPVVDSRLANTVPPGLAADPEFWYRLVVRAIRARQKRESPGPLMNVDAILELRGKQLANLHRPPTGLALARRRLLKLVRDPQKFLADSHFPLLRHLGRIIYSASG